MSLLTSKFKIFKKVLGNGLTVLVKPTHNVPRVETHLWYNVGSKDEGVNERGMAHLIEHMLFKGTKNLSESDLNLICQKLTIDANAFTSQDYTCYTFRLPSHLWETTLELLAECMQHARFDPEMLASELKAVIEELRMYKEDFQGSLLEQIIASMFPEHPYHNPIIGSKVDLCALNRDDLYAFYKKHYHPANGVLVLTGNIEPDLVFAAAERLFGHIPSPKEYTKNKFHIQDDLVARSTVLFRPTNGPWYCYAYKVPGFQEGKNHLLDIASLILASGKSSRLYQRLVNQEKLAVDVDCSVYDFFERGLICIGVWPTEGQQPQIIEEILQEELAKLGQAPVHEWEFAAAQKRTQVDFTTLLESTEKQAFVIGNSYLATGDADFVEKYLAAVAATTKKQLQQFYAEIFNPSMEHKGYLLPITKNDVKKMVALQMESEKLDNIILERHKRTKPVEPAKWANKITESPVSNFTFPKPQTFSLPNGLDLIYHDNALVPQVVGILSFKANYLYESAKNSGVFGFLLRVITDSTQDHDAEEFAKFLETEGIHLAAGSDSIVFRCLSSNLEKALKIVAAIIKNPTFHKASIEKVRQQMLCEIDEFWDAPLDFVDQIAKEAIYQDHPYHKLPLGDKKSVKALDKKDLQQIFETFISPKGANLVIVGDMEHADIHELVELYFGAWKGPEIPELTYPPLQEHKPQVLQFPINRDQVVLALAAPSLSRKDPDYNALSLLDIIVTGGAQGAPFSRIFQLREKTGLFYTIGGSLLYGAREEPGMIFIKTIVTPDKVESAQKMILDTLDEVGKNGISVEDLEMAKNLLFASSIELFESNIQMAQTFLFLKKLNLSFNLFDKQGEILSIIKVDHVNRVAQRYCDKHLLTVMQVGRVKKTQKVSFQKRRVR